MQNLKTLLLSAPEDQMDPSLKPIIEKWTETPTALNILELLDAAVHGGAASGFVVQALQGFLEVAIVNENTTYDAVVAQAYWRHPVQ